MFGKFLLTVTVIAIIWFGYKYLGRMAELRQRKPGGPRPETPAQDAGAAEIMVECKSCGTWQPARSAKACGRNDCPY
ncbi:conserved hypothetical protein [Candidatus Terasakiella magnetica]|nr:conserved hypothetical protein [Candidatus Terasakiella magnetica]